MSVQPIGPPPAKDDTFHDARLKINRARRHFFELRNVLVDHIANHPIVYDMEPGGFFQEGSTTYRHVEATITVPPLPDEASAIIGDVIHNLRASLDLMASALARANGKSDNGVHFPFAVDEAGLGDQIKRKNFSRCGADAVALVRSLRPYHKGNLQLRALHDLDLSDKHRRLVPAPDVKPVLNIHTDTWTPVPGTGHDYTLVFPEGTGLAGEEIIMSLESLVQLCESILEAFAALEAP